MPWSKKKRPATSTQGFSLIFAKGLRRCAKPPSSGSACHTNAANGHQRREYAPSPSPSPFQRCSAQTQRKKAYGQGKGGLVAKTRCVNVDWPSCQIHSLARSHRWIDHNRTTDNTILSCQEGLHCKLLRFFLVLTWKIRYSIHDILFWTLFQLLAHVQSSAVILESSFRIKRTLRYRNRSHGVWHNTQNTSVCAFGHPDIFYQVL